MVLFATCFVMTILVVNATSQSTYISLSTKGSLSIPALKLPQVHSKELDKVVGKIQTLIDGSHDTLQIIADFDLTMTKSHASNGEKLPDCFELRQITNKYQPIMLDPSLPLEVKIPLIVEWYDAKHDLLIQNNLYKKDFASMVTESSMSFRDGMPDFVKDLDDAKVPILIFSAGVGDVIDEALRQHNLMKPNVKVISNYMTYDTEGKLIKFAGQPIHMFNKNESEVTHSASYFLDVADRQNVILLGDSIGDLQMSHGVESPRTVLTIGFFNDKIQEKLELYKSKFDIVLVDDQTMNISHAILKLILANK